MSKYNALIGMGNIGDSIMQIINPAQTVSTPIISISFKPPDIPIHIKEITPEKIEELKIELMLEEILRQETGNLANFSMSDLENTLSWLNLSLNSGSYYDFRINITAKQKEEILKNSEKIIKGKKTLENGDNFDKWNDNEPIIYKGYIYKNKRSLVVNFLDEKIKSIIKEREAVKKNAFKSFYNKNSSNNQSSKKFNSAIKNKQNEISKINELVDNLKKVNLAISTTALVAASMSIGLYLLAPFTSGATIVPASIAAGLAVVLGATAGAINIALNIYDKKRTSFQKVSTSALAIFNIGHIMHNTVMVSLAALGVLSLASSFIVPGVALVGSLVATVLAFLSYYG